MSEAIKPALTATGWGTVLVNENGAVIPVDFGDGIVRELYPPSYHKLAALCLYNQPFGFTRKDVELVRRCEKKEKNFWLKSLADRIEALLPPE